LAAVPATSILVLYGLVGRPLAFDAARVAYACVRTVGSVLATAVLAGNFLADAESFHLPLFGFPVERLGTHEAQIRENAAELVPVGTEVDGYATVDW
jgi:hypothetical protein